MMDEQSFEGAVNRLQALLESQNYPANIAWIWPNDAILTERMAYVKWPLPAANRTRVKAIFDQGMRIQRGVLLASFCETPEETCCYIWVPQTDEEALYHLMPGGVKLSVPIETSRRTAHKVTSRLMWIWLKLRYRKLQKYKEQLFQ